MIEGARSFEILIAFGGPLVYGPRDGLLVVACVFALKFASAIKRCRPAPGCRR
jgi:hypothetical protein